MRNDLPGTACAMDPKSVQRAGQAGFGHRTRRGTLPWRSTGGERGPGLDTSVSPHMESAPIRGNAPPIHRTVRLACGTNPSGTSPSSRSIDAPDVGEIRSFAAARLACPASSVAISVHAADEVEVRELPAHVVGI